MDASNLSRRGFLTLGAGLIAAPAIVKAASIMRVKPVRPVFTSMDFGVRSTGQIWVANEVGCYMYSDKLSEYLRVELAQRCRFTEFLNVQNGYAQTHFQRIPS